MTKVLHNAQERERFLRFATVGAIGTVVDFVIMNLMVWLGRSSLVVAGTVSFIAAVLNNFVLNRYWTYPESRTKHFVGQLGQFGLVSIAGLVIRIPILTFGEPALDSFLASFDISAHEFISHNITLAIAIGIVMMWNFFINRYWTYRHIDQAEEE